MKRLTTLCAVGATQIDFSTVDLRGRISVFDIWEEKNVGSFEGSYTARAVPLHGTAFLRLSIAESNA